MLCTRPQIPTSVAPYDLLSAITDTQGPPPLPRTSTSKRISTTGVAPAPSAAAAPATAATAAPLSATDLPAELHALADPSAAVSLPAPGSVEPTTLDNWKLDKLVASLGRSRTTWRRALMLYEWLRASNHALDDRLCTTVR